MSEKGSDSAVLLRRLKRLLMAALGGGFSLFFLGILLVAALCAAILGVSSGTSSNTSSLDTSSVGIANADSTYIRLIFQYAEKYGMEPAYLLAIMDHESNFNPRTVSTAGARGLMQVMPDTFADAQKWIAADGEKTDSYSNIFDPEVNIRAATRYLKEIKDSILKGADIRTQAAGYNLGPYGVKGYLSNPLYSDDGRSLNDNVFANNLLGLDQRADMGNKDYGSCVEIKYNLYKSLIQSGQIKADGTVGNIGGSGDGITTGNFIWPTPGTTTITSGVGPRWGTSHNGIDISSGDAYGKPIVASDGGVVTVAVSSGWGGGYGIHCYIEHNSGYTTRYGHMSKIAVKEGDRVSQGQVIGYIGSTGDSTGPHLHFEIRDPSGNICDPEKFVNP